ncbi:MAG TPA: (d)CMP kinase [Bacteroidia bacterium]|nr:(d)CMP kinase [Bacteroidia bacterium]
MKKIIVAIDGFSSCGKSTLSRGLAKKLGYKFIDTGAMYRAVALYLLDHHIDYHDVAVVEHALHDIHIEFEYNPSREASDTLLNGVNIEDEIRDMRVANIVSHVSSISAVRRFLVKQQQKMGEKRGIVMDGRDIGTVVFPDAELKIFLTADEQIRAHRRQNELADKGQRLTYEEVLKNLHDRDLIDTTREDSPLKKADDALLLDNSDIGKDEQLNLAYKWAMNRINQASA